MPFGISLNRFKKKKPAEGAKEPLVSNATEKRRTAYVQVNMEIKSGRLAGFEIEPNVKFVDKKSESGKTQRKHLKGKHRRNLSEGALNDLDSVLQEAVTQQNGTYKNTPDGELSSLYAVEADKCGSGKEKRMSRQSRDFVAEGGAKEGISYYGQADDFKPAKKGCFGFCRG